METKQNSTVQSIDRVLDILEALAASPRGLFLKDLSALTGLHTSTVHRLLATLVTRGYAFKEESTGKYRMSMRMFSLSNQVMRETSIVDFAREPLRELAMNIGEVVHLVTLDGTEILYLLKEDPGRNAIRMGSYIGVRNPLYCTSVGKCILAYLPTEEMERIWYSTTPYPFTEKTIVTLPAMQEELKKIRQLGYAIDDEEHEAGVRCLGMAVQDHRGMPVAAISISASASRMEQSVIERYAVLLRSVTDEISRALGAAKLP